MSQLDNPFSYFFYAKKRWGFADAVRRTWTFFLRPGRIAGAIQQRYIEWKLIDRREKRTYSRDVYAIDRDGDLYLVECPSCHEQQTLSVYYWQQDDPCHRCGKTGTTHFHCFKCPIGFDVWLEDGLREIKDHREGNVPLPSTLVWDENRKVHLGISAAAPWWWTRREICRDLQANGKDAHGHKPYQVWQIDAEWIKSQQLQGEAECNCDGIAPHFHQLPPAPTGPDFDPNNKEKESR